MRLIGLLAIALSFALMCLQIEPFATFFYLFAWFGLIFTFDQLIRVRAGHSLIAHCQIGGSALLLFWSSVSWFFFELINFRLDNWYYVFVTDQPALRLLSTFLAFATVFPGIFWIEHYLRLRGVCTDTRWRPLRFSSRGLYLLQLLGVLSIALPLTWPRYFFPLIWGALILLIAPINYRHGLDGYLRQLERGDYGQTLRLLLAGLITGLCWEFFNFWARAKWIYTVPFFDELKLFEMPVAGFFGFPALRRRMRHRIPAIGLAPASAGFWRLSKTKTAAQLDDHPRRANYRSPALSPGRRPLYGAVDHHFGHATRRTHRIPGQRNLSNAAPTRHSPPHTT